MVEQSEVVEVRPCSLVGAAAILRQEYIRGEIMRDDQALMLRDQSTGEFDIARPLSDDERIQRRLENARNVEQRRRIGMSERAKREARRKREWRKRKNITDSPVLKNN